MYVYARYEVSMIKTVIGKTIHRHRPFFFYYLLDYILLQGFSKCCDWSVFKIQVKLRSKMFLFVDQITCIGNRLYILCTIPT